MNTLLGFICVVIGLAPIVLWLGLSGQLPTVLRSGGIALEMLRLHKLRAFLTMLGVIIGVMSVTLIVMVSNGFQYFLTSEFERLGSDTIFVAFDRFSTKQRTSIEGLTLDDVKYLQDQIPQIDVVAPIVQVPVTKVSANAKEVTNCRIWASNENYLTLNRVRVMEGRAIDANDEANRANVCLIGPEINERLFDNKGLGETIQLQGITLEVIGITERFDIMGQTNARDLLVPLATVQDKWVGGDTVTYISMRPKTGYSVQETVEQVWQAMMRRSGNKRIYRVDSRESILNIFNVVLGGAGTVLAGIAGLSLLVGGIGIMNIMLVSVTERTREIGLRKAVGARRSTILIQFLVEAAVLSMIGGLIGMGLAFMFGLGITELTKALKVPSEAGLQMPFPLPAAVASMLFSALIGVVFGFFPAMSASRLNPIDALRKE